MFVAFPRTLASPLNKKPDHVGCFILVGGFMMKRRRVDHWFFPIKPQLHIPTTKTFFMDKQNWSKPTKIRTKKTTRQNPKKRSSKKQNTKPFSFGFFVVFLNLNQPPTRWTNHPPAHQPLQGSAQGQMITGKDRITVQLATSTEICRSRTKDRCAQKDVRRPGENGDVWTLKKNNLGSKNEKKKTVLMLKTCVERGWKETRFANRYY